MAKNGNLVIFINADTPPVGPEKFTLVQAIAEIKAEEAGSVQILERRLNDALADLYKLAPMAKVTGFHCSTDF